LAKKKIIEKKDIEKVDTIQIKYLKELKTILKASFMGIYKDSQVQAASELNKANYIQPTTSQEFLDLLEQETFAYIGDWQYNITKAMRNQLVIAIKEGKPLSSVINIMDDEGKSLSEVSLERYSRTKHTEVMNRGRLETFQSSGVVAAYQYSAILDDRTSDICRGLDGKIFKAGSEPVPPMHFNCRSVLIPITKYEEFEVDTHIGKTPITDFIEENKGKGFAIK
jgi:SPP1 gp7 family putative phage head morphogenesis protein